MLRGGGCGVVALGVPIRRSSPDAPLATPLKQFLQRQQPLRMDQLHQPKLEMEALLLPVVQIVKRPQHDLQIARDLLFA